MTCPCTPFKVSQLLWPHLKLLHFQNSSFRHLTLKPLTFPAESHLFPLKPFANLIKTSNPLPFYFSFLHEPPPLLFLDSNSIISVSLLQITTCAFTVFLWQNVISANTQLSFSVPTPALVCLEKITQWRKFAGL